MSRHRFSAVIAGIGATLIILIVVITRHYPGQVPGGKAAAFLEALLLTPGGIIVGISAFIFHPRGFHEVDAFADYIVIAAWIGWFAVAYWGAWLYKRPALSHAPGTRD